MQLTCPACNTLLEVPDQFGDAERVRVVCGACQHQFRVLLKRPTLKVRPRSGEYALSDRVREELSRPDGEGLEGILLTSSVAVEGREVAQDLGKVGISVPVTAGQGEAFMLEAFAQAQQGLRQQARALGADGVVSVQMTASGPEDAQVLQLSGQAVRLGPAGE